MAEKDDLLQALLESMMRVKIPVSGNIYRSPARLTNPDGVWYERWHIDVWDTEFVVSILVLEKEPSPELVAAMFRELKAERQRKDLGDTPTP